MPEVRVSAEDLLEAAEAGRLRVPVEVGAFIALRCVEELTEQPRGFSPADVLFDETGGVVVVGDGPGGEHAATLAATSLLKRLLLASAGASPSSLLDWLERSRGATSLHLEEMRDEVEAALVPLNREAATRLLARFIRSSASARRDEASAGGATGGRSVDAALDRFLEGERGGSAPAAHEAQVASRLVEKKPRRGPGLGLTIVVLALAAILGLALSRPELIFPGG